MTAETTVDFDFDTEDDAADLPPLCTFRLGGKVWHVKNDDLISLGVMNQALSDKGMQVTEYFRAVLVPDEIPAFEKMLADPPADVSLGKIRAAMSKTATRVLGFPTTAASGSSSASPARAQKRASSRARSSSQGTRRRASGE